MYTGFLQLQEKKLNDSRTVLEYVIPAEGNFINLTEELNNLLNDKVHILIKDLNEKYIFNEEGILLYQRIGSSYYIFVGRKNLDRILKESLQHKISISIKCLAERDKVIKS